jgi:hypothetical protein
MAKNELRRDMTISTMANGSEKAPGFWAVEHVHLVDGMAIPFDS